MFPNCAFLHVKLPSKHALCVSYLDSPISTLRITMKSWFTAQLAKLCCLRADFSLGAKCGLASFYKAFFKVTEYLDIEP